MTSALRIFDDVACTACGCVCDDLTVTVSDRIVNVANGCSLADSWLLNQAHPTGIATINGQPVALELAAQHAAGILRAARNPLIYGLERCSTEGLRAAIELAERIGATIDVHSGKAPTLAMQQVGECTCTLGDVRRYADLIILWGCDPVTTHPRFFERYLPAKRHLIVVDCEETATASAADEYLRIDPELNWEAIWTLRLSVAGMLVDCNPQWKALADRMKSCRSGVVFYGRSLTDGPLAHRTVEALLQLVTDLNDHTRFSALHLRRGADDAESVLTWHSGYPFGVNYASGHPRYNPSEFSGIEMLARGEADACLLIGCDAVDGFPPESVAHLKGIPVIRVDMPGTACGLECAVSFTTAVKGIHTKGTAQRLDGVSIPLKVLLPMELPSEAEVIAKITDAIGEM